MKASPADTALVHAAKAGDLAAFEELTTRHERQIYSLAYRILQNPHDAEDVTQRAGARIGRGGLRPASPA